MRMINSMTVKFPHLKTIILSLSVITSSFAAENPCKAKTLKAANQITEDGKGYVKALKNDSATEKCVTTINEKRHLKYTKIAEKENVTVDQVAAVAAQKLG